MPKINETNNKFRWLYLSGFAIIIALPILVMPPWFFPPDWGKTIVFRSILAIMLFFFAFQILHKKIALILPNFKKNKIVWALAALFAVFLLATFFSVDPYFSLWGSPLRSGGFITFAFYFVFALLAFILFKKEDWEKAWIFSIFVGIMVSFVAIIQSYNLFKNIFVPANHGASSTIGNPIFLGIYLLLLSFPTLSFAVKEHKPKLKIFYILSLALFIFAIILAQSRAAYFGIIAGAIYFLFFYPKKLKILKVLTGTFLLLVVATVFYMNGEPQARGFLGQNKIFAMLQEKLSIKNALNDERLRTWQIALKEVEDRPILGWGPENLAVGFDKHYDPKIMWSPWWDKAHDIFLDIGASAGVLGVLAYIYLFITLFWQLQKEKRETTENSKKIIINGIQATMIGYLVANFFSFDSFSTYLLFFFIIGYSLHLSGSGTIEEKQNSAKKIKNPGIIMGFLFILLLIFLWQYNLLPLTINASVNKSDDLSSGKNCQQAVSLMDNASKNNSFLNSYVDIKYVEMIKTCAGFYPENNLAYAKKGVEILKNGVKIQPLYTRSWIYLGSLTTIIADNEQNPQIRNNLIKEAYSYFDKARSLSPLHAETLLEQTKTDMVSGNYSAMRADAENCEKINPSLNNCYWQKVLADIYLKDLSGAEPDTKTAASKGFNLESKPMLNDLALAYATAQNYQKLIETYQKLIETNPGAANYHSSLAAVYAKTGEYKKARDQAMIFLQLMPEAKDEVDAFLKTLPY